MSEIQRIENSKIELDGARAISDVLEACFPDTFEGRNYFKQEPHVRLLAFEGASLVGHVGLDYRVINVGGEILSIVGVIDLCVVAKHRGIGIASELLAQVESTSAGRDFSILMADNPKIYKRCGYRSLASAPIQWLAIEERTSIDIMERDFSDCFMFKPLNERDWPSGQIDLLGYLF